MAEGRVQRGKGEREREREGGEERERKRGRNFKFFGGVNFGSKMAKKCCISKWWILALAFIRDVYTHLPDRTCPQTIILPQNTYTRTRTPTGSCACKCLHTRPCTCTLTHAHRHSRTHLLTFSLTLLTPTWYDLKRMSTSIQYKAFAASQNNTFFCSGFHGFHGR